MENNQSRIVFLGLKHSGKSTVARLAARFFDLDFLDLDESIADLARARFLTLAPVLDASLCVRTLYKQQGKAVFQDLEAQATGMVVEAPSAGIVIALGGGTMENEAAMDRLRGNGLTIFLDSPVDVLYERIIRGGIPAFLDPEKPRESFEVLFVRRRALSKENADVSIEIGHKNVESVFDLVQPIIKEYLNGR